MILLAGGSLFAQEELTPAQKKYLRDVYRRITQTDFSKLEKPDEKKDPVNGEPSSSGNDDKQPQARKDGDSNSGIDHAEQAVNSPEAILKKAIKPGDPLTLTENKELMDAYLDITRSGRAKSAEFPSAQAAPAGFNKEAAYKFLRDSLKVLPPDSPEAVQIRNYLESKNDE